MQEIDDRSLQRCNKIVFDTIHGAKEEAGEFYRTRKGRKMNFFMLQGELGDLASGLISGR